jgi:CBS domain-containing protein
VTKLDEVEGLTAADVMHRHLTTLPATTTVGELRAYFAASASRRVALLTDHGRYLGSIAAASIPEAVDAGAAAADFVVRGPTIHPAEPATSARDVALEQTSLRLPVIDDAGALVGIVAITGRRDGFCGT